MWEKIGYTVVGMMVVFIVIGVVVGVVQGLLYLGPLCLGFIPLTILGFVVGRYMQKNEFFKE